MGRFALRRAGPATFGTVLFALCAMFSSSSSYACPPGTVFSAFNGRGICAFVGEGSLAAAICFKTKGRNCPAGFEFHHKASDPTHDYCCPTQKADFFSKQCEIQCRPLLESVQPTSEATRVYNNCVVGCGNPNGAITCPDGHLVQVGQACN
jgi:hypothetical protein